MIRQHINYFRNIHLILFVISLITAFYTVAFHIGFLIMPLICMVSGFLSFTFFRERAVLLFLFLLPLINSTPAFIPNGYPFNLMALTVFWLAGVVMSKMISEDKWKEYSGFTWGKYYYFFLFIVWISAIFVLIRWSNLFFYPSVMFADTPVSPGIPDVPRNSFASIYPVITLFLYTVAPFGFEIVRTDGIDRKNVFKSLSSGYFISFLIAIWQRYSDPGFMSVKWWTEKLGQSNGGFSDFNGFGIFSGILFLWSMILIVKDMPSGSRRTKTIMMDNKWYLFSMAISFAGIFFSGSRTAFIFLLSGFIFFMISAKIKIKAKVFIVIMLIVLIFITGSVLEKRLKDSFTKIFDPETNGDIVKVLDKVSNGRIGMIIDSIPIIRNYPLNGLGTGNFIFFREYLKYGTEFIYDLPLNQYLLILDENGIPGLLFFGLFFLSLFRSRFIKSAECKVVLVISIVLLVGNSFWLPEIFILFWILVGLGIERKEGSDSKKKSFRLPILAVFVLFLVSSVLTENSIHPSKLMAKRGLNYDFGFWEESVKSNFRWTKKKSGIYLTLDEDGSSPEISISCGAPLQHLKGKFQEVILEWNGEIIRKKRFFSNEKFSFKIKGKPYESSFLEINTNPLFNLKKLGIGKESRDLGVMFFYR